MYCPRTFRLHLAHDSHIQVQKHVSQYKAALHNSHVVMGNSHVPMLQYTASGELWDIIDYPAFILRYTPKQRLAEHVWFVCREINTALCEFAYYRSHLPTASWMDWSSIRARQADGHRMTRRSVNYNTAMITRIQSAYFRPVTTYLRVQWIRGYGEHLSLMTQHACTAIAD